MLTLIPNSPRDLMEAERIATALRNDGCDVYIDEGFANSALNRIYVTGGKWILHVEGKQTVRLRNKYSQDVVSGIRIRTFIADWRSYLEE